MVKLKRQIVQRFNTAYRMSMIENIDNKACRMTITVWESDVMVSVRRTESNTGIVFSYLNKYIGDKDMDIDFNICGRNIYLEAQKGDWKFVYECVIND